MKLKVKYTATKKFVLNFTGNTLGELIESAKLFIVDTYGDPCPNLGLSLNGVDPLEGQDTPIRDLGVVPMDLLTVITLNGGPQANSGSQDSASVGGSGQSGVGASGISQDRVEGTSSGSGASAISDIGGGPSGSGVGGGPSGSGVGARGVSGVGGQEASPPPPSSLLDVSPSSPHQLPSSLHQLFTSCRPSGGPQVVNLITHLTMLECGWRNAAGSTPNAAADDSVSPPPTGWDGLVATLNYTHSSYQNFSCSLVLVSMGQMKQILVSFPDQDIEISTKVNVDDYVKIMNSSGGDNATKGVKLEDISNVAKLSQTLRNELLVPLQLAAHRILGLPSPFHLAGLPLEVLLKILRKIDIKSALLLSSCCRRLNDSVNDNSLWQHYYRRDLGAYYSHSSEGNSSTWMTKLDWKNLYKVRYDQDKKQRIGWNNPLPYPDMERPNPRIYPTGPQFPHPAPGFPFQPDPVGPYPSVPNPTPPFNPFNDPDSPHYGGDIPNGPPHNPNHPYGQIYPRNPLGPLGPLGGDDPMNNPLGPFGGGGDPMNPFGDPMHGGLGPGMPGRPNRRLPPRGGPGGFRFI